MESTVEAIAASEFHAALSRRYTAPRWISGTISVVAVSVLLLLRVGTTSRASRDSRGLGAGVTSRLKRRPRLHS